MAFPGHRARRTSSPLLLLVAGALFATAPWWLPRALSGMQFTRVWTIAFVVVGVLFLVMAADSRRRRSASSAA